MILMNPVLVKLSFELLLSGGHLGTGEEWVSLTLTYRPTGQHTPLSSPPVIFSFRVPLLPTTLQSFPSQLLPCLSFLMPRVAERNA